MALDQATNPFAAARAALVSQFFVTPPPSFRPMVFALSAVHAVTLLVTLAALLLRWRAGTKGDCFWFIRIVATEHGRFIHPNPITLWLVCSSLFLAVMQVYAWELIRSTNNKGSDLTGWVLTRGFLWWPGEIGGWFVAWGTTLASILPRSGTSRLARHPLLINTFFIACPVVFLGLSAPAIAFANKEFNTAFSIFVDLEQSLFVAAQEFDLSGNASRLPTFLAALERLGHIRTDRLVPSWRSSWIVLSFFNALMLAVYTAAAMQHHRTIGKSINQLQQRRVVGGTDAYARQQRNLAWALRSLRFTACSFFFICAGYEALVLTIAIRTEPLVNGSSNFSNIASLFAIFIFAVFGSFANFALFARSISIYRTRGESIPSIIGVGSTRHAVHRKNSLHITVTREVVEEMVVEFDVELREKDDSGEMYKMAVAM